MAFNYYTINSIKNIDIDNIPEKFKIYYNGLSDEMKAEIADVRPDLVQAVGGTIVSNIDVSETQEKVIGSLNDENVLLEEEDDEIEDPVLDEWESMPISAWQENRVNAKVIVCKIMPQHNRVCRAHRIQMVEKNLRIAKKPHGTYSIIGYFCPECVDFYLEDHKLDPLLKKVDELKIPTIIQPLDITMQDWKENGIPVDVSSDDIIYIPDTWVEGQMYCPLHLEEVLLEDNYRKSYAKRHVDFEACYCKQCKKIIMRNSKAQQLEEDCAEIGIPPISFKPLRKEKTVKNTIQRKKVPDYFVVNGIIQNYSFVSDIEWDILDEDDIMVVSYSRICSEEDHETEDRLGLIRVREKKGGLKYYLVYLGYCDQCEQYYIEQEDYELIYAKGRPFVTIIDEVEADYMITSGSVFDSEQEHLEQLEKEFTDRISDIEKLPDYVAEFAVISGANNDDAIGQLKYEKEHCRPYYEEIAQIRGYQDNPYEHRADIVFNGKTEVYYLGVNDVFVNGVRKVISNRSNLGRALVNYRNLDVIKDGKKYDVKRRRKFDIVKARLFGYMEQSDEDAFFQKGITDQFLINVLNMRKRQHQLIDIIATIQEKQNEIIDQPLTENLIVQGCAGSGKTMVLLHRLSILKYNHPDYDFTRVVILTPNENFNTHIAGLAGSLQIGYVNRYSVEEYYRQLLLEYDNSFRVSGKISDEMNVPQIYVDFVYSDRFINLLNEAFEIRIQKLRDYYAQVESLSLKAERNVLSCDGLSGYELIAPLISELHSVSEVFSNKNEKYNRAWERYTTVKQRYDFLDAKVKESDKTLRQVITEQCQIVKEKIGNAIQERERKIKELDQSIEECIQEYERVNGASSDARKTQKLGTIKGKITRAENRKDVLKDEISVLSSKAEADISIMSEEEVHSYLNSLYLYIQGIADHNRFISSQRKILENYQTELADMPVRLFQIEQEVEIAKADRIPSEILERVHALEEELNEITPKTVFADVYAAASQKADDILKSSSGKSYIKNIKGTHRYDLYLQLLFAQEYFDKAAGNNTLICIDEGQDLTTNEYRLIRSVNRTPPVFNIFGDTNQLLKYGRGISDWKQISDVIGESIRFDLNENYRNTNQIIQYCNKTFDMHIEPTGVDGHKVKELTRYRLESALSELKPGEESVAVILPRSVKKKEEYLDKERLPYPIRKAIGKEIGYGKIAVMYADEVKGIEFDRVFVVPNSMTKNERYIAYTRALSDLIIVIDEELDPKEEEKVLSEKTDQKKKEKKPVKVSANVKMGKVRKKKRNGDTDTSGNSKKKKVNSKQIEEKSEAKKNNKPPVEIIPAEENEPEMPVDALSLSAIKRVREDFSDENINYLNDHGIYTIGEFRALTEKQINDFPGSDMGEQLIKWSILQLKNELENFVKKLESEVD